MSLEVEPHCRELYEERLAYWSNAEEAALKALEYARSQIHDAQVHIAQIAVAQMAE